jgi:hypothetical protein
VQEEDKNIQTMSVELSSNSVEVVLSPKPITCNYPHIRILNNNDDDDDDDITSENPSTSPMPFLKSFSGLTWVGCCHGASHNLALFAIGVGAILIS